MDASTLETCAPLSLHCQDRTELTAAAAKESGTDPPMCASRIHQRGDHIPRLSAQMHGNTQDSFRSFRKAKMPWCRHMRNAKGRAAEAAAGDAVTAPGGGVRGNGARLTVGGCGGLAVPDGGRLADTDGFPSALLPKVKAHEEAVVLLAASPIAWAWLAPPEQVGLGERTGRYRLAPATLVRDAVGRSEISYEDFARAVIDELEAVQPGHARGRDRARTGRPDPRRQAA